MNISIILKKIRRCRNNQDIKIEELKDIMNLDEQVILLDVRSPQEYAEGHLNRSYKYTII